MQTILLRDMSDILYYLYITVNWRPWIRYIFNFINLYNSCETHFHLSIKTGFQESCRFIDNATQFMVALGKCVANFHEAEAFKMSYDEFCDAHCPYRQDRSMNKTYHFAVSLESNPFSYSIRIFSSFIILFIYLSIFSRRAHSPLY